MPTKINTTVDSLVLHWMSLTVEDLSTNHEGLGMTVGQCIGIFYADDGMIGSRDTEWFQGAINVLI